MEIGKSVYNSVMVSVHNSLHKSLYNSVWVSVGTSPWKSAWNSLRISINDSVGDLTTRSVRQLFEGIIKGSKVISVSIINDSTL